jgi:HAAS
VDTNPLVRDYLGRLDAAAWLLPADRRAELLGEVREHIGTALGDAARSDEVSVRNVLERLGPPEEIVAAEREPGVLAGSPAPAPMSTIQASSPWGAIEVIALLLLTVGAIFLPFVGPLLGLVFVWLSTRWSTRVKLVATGIVVVLLILPFVLLFAVSTTGAPVSGVST